MTKSKERKKIEPITLAMTQLYAMYLSTIYQYSLRYQSYLLLRAYWYHLVFLFLYSFVSQNRKRTKICLVKTVNFLFPGIKKWPGNKFRTETVSEKDLLLCSQERKWKKLFHNRKCYWEQKSYQTQT